MSDLTDPKTPTTLKTQNSLFATIKRLVIETQQAVVAQVNNHLTLLYWQIGQHINHTVLQQEKAEYGKQTVKQLSEQLSQEFGRGFSYSALTRMQKFHQQFSEQQKVATLSQQLSWSHFVELIAIKDDLARDFYAQMAINDRWSVRTLRNRMDAMLFERTAISNKPDELIQIELDKLSHSEQPSISTDLLLKDPYLLYFLRVKDHYLEKDLEDAILRELELFLLELGSGFSFIGRQHRVHIGQEDFYIDLLFYNRKLKRLVAIDLKLGKFKAAYKGQMELYLRYLAKFEQEADEKPPLGIILCASKDDEQVELLELDQSGIHVAEYLTALPSKALLQQKLHQAIQNNQQRLAGKKGGE